MLDCMDDLRKISDLRVPVNWCVMFFKQNLKRQCGLDYIFVSETELTFLLSFKCVGFIVFICCCFFVCVCTEGTPKPVPSIEKWFFIQVPLTVGKRTMPFSATCQPSLEFTVVLWNYWPMRSLRRATAPWVPLSNILEQGHPNLFSSFVIGWCHFYM